LINNPTAALHFFHNPDIALHIVLIFDSAGESGNRLCRGATCQDL